MLTKHSLARVLIRNAVMAGGAALIGVLVVVFLSSRIDSVTEDIVAAKRLSTALDARNEALAGLVADIRSTASATERIEAALLPARDILEFVGAVESMAQKHNVTEAIRFDTPSETLYAIDRGPIVAIPFSLSVQGNVFTFLAYLNDLERLPYFTRVGTIAVSSPQDGGWENLSTISMQGVLYATSE